MNSRSKSFRLAFLTVLSIHFILRYPFSESQTDVDGMQLSIYSAQGMSIGLFPDWLSILSLAGLYPFSYPAATSIIIAVLGVTTDIDINIITLILAYYGSFAGITGVFLCLRELFNSRPIYPLMGMYFYSVSYYYISFTTWAASARGPHMSFLPFFIFLLLRYRNVDNKYPYLIMMLLIIVLLFTNHRMFLIAFPLYIISYLLATFAMKFRHSLLRVNIRFHYILFFIFMVFLLASLFQISYLTIFQINTYHNWGREWFSHSLFLPVNLFLDYSMRLNNILFSFSVFGGIFLFLSRNKTFTDYFILSSLFISTPFFIDREYFIPTFMVISTILSVYFLHKISEYIPKNKTKISQLCLFLLIVFSLFLTNFQLKINNEPAEMKYGNPDNKTLTNEWIAQGTVSTSIWYSEYVSLERVGFSGNAVQMHICTNTSCSSLSDISLFFTLESFAGSLNIIEYPFIESLRGDSYYVGGNIERNGEVYEPNGYQLRFRNSPENYYNFLDGIGLDYIVVSLLSDPITGETDENSPISVWSDDKFYKLYDNGYERISKV